MSFCFRAQGVYSMNMSFLPALSWKTKNIKVIPTERATKYDRKLISTPILCRPAPRTIPLQTPWNKGHQCKHVQMHIVNTNSYSNLSYKISPFKLQWWRKVLEAMWACRFSATTVTSGAPNVNFGKYLFGRRFEIQNFRNICCKISCLPVSLGFSNIYGLIAHF